MLNHWNSKFSGFGAYSLKFETGYIVQTDDDARYMDIQQAVNLSILHEFASRGIKLVYLMQTVFVRAN